MAFPQVGSSATSNETSNQTTHNMSLPASIVASDLLLGFFGMDLGGGSAGQTVSWPAGWTELHDTEDAADVLLSAAYRIANGAESGTVDVTSSKSDRSSHAILRVTAASWHGTTPPEVGTATLNGSTSTPNPPGVTASWGSEDNLFITYIVGDAPPTSYPVTTDPTNYGSGIEAVHNNASSCFIRLVRRELASDTDDPGTWTLTGAEDCITNTMVIRPAGAAPASVLQDPVGMGVIPFPR